jgi:hypothetical protein
MSRRLVLSFTVAIALGKHQRLCGSADPWPHEVAEMGSPAAPPRARRWCRQQYALG